jgi:NAD(P)-dependent dehydrogenase (short-subunit alcohol dehydrogenase family)
MPSALITGANRGIGLEFARQYLADGWHVYATCRHPGSASELQQLAEASDHKLRIMALDVTDSASVKGRPRNSTGKPLTSSSIMPASAGLVARLSEISITQPGRRCSTSTPWGPCGLQRRLLTMWHEASASSIADNTSGGAFAYRSSKAAVNMVVRSLAIDLAPRGITCVVVNPGWVRTDMGGSHATLTPAESVNRLRDLIETLGPAQSGKFFNHDGREYPW